jgi:hypothetical protein
MAGLLTLLKAVYAAMDGQELSWWRVVMFTTFIPASTAGAAMAAASNLSEVTRSLSSAQVAAGSF